jgi:hypothetical protein
LRRQYASVGAAATKALREERAAIEATAARGVDVGNLVDETNERVAMVDGFVTAYRQYCWDVNGIEDLALAPFQILAGEAEVSRAEGSPLAPRHTRSTLRHGSHDLSDHPIADGRRQ